MKNNLDIEDRLEQLEHEIYLLKRSIHRLAITYVENPKYPYWSKLLCFQVDDDKRKDFEFALSILSDRLSNTKIIIIEDDDINDDIFESDDTFIPKSKANKYPKELFDNSIPTLDNVIPMLCSIIGLRSQRMINELLDSMRLQGMFVELIDHLLPKEND